MQFNALRRNYLGNYRANRSGMNACTAKILAAIGMDDFVVRGSTVRNFAVLLKMQQHGCC